MRCTTHCGWPGKPRIAEEAQRFFDPLSVNDQNRSFWEDPARTGPFLQAVGEALRQGPVGPAWESLIAFEPCPVVVIRQ
jgi:hypothetical protein